MVDRADVSRPGGLAGAVLSVAGAAAERARRARYGPPLENSGDLCGRQAPLRQPARARRTGGARRTRECEAGRPPDAPRGPLRQAALTLSPDHALGSRMAGGPESR